MTRALIFWESEGILKELATVGGFDLQSHFIGDGFAAPQLRRLFIQTIGQSALSACACGDLATALPENFRGIAVLDVGAEMRIKPAKAAARISGLMNTEKTSPLIRTLLLNEPWDAFLIENRLKPGEPSEILRLLTPDILVCGLPTTENACFFLRRSPVPIESVSEWNEAAVLGDTLAQIGLSVPKEFNYTPEPNADAPVSAYEAQEEMIIQKRLEDLGYI